MAVGRSLEPLPIEFSDLIFRDIAVKGSPIADIESAR